jgi:hypothetical protein
MVEQPARRRYSLVIPETLYQEIEEVAIELDTAVVEVIKRFLKLSLLAYRLQKEDDAALLIEDSDGIRQIYIV